MRVIRLINNRKLLTGVFVLIFSLIAFGQFENLGLESPWYEGKIVLNDNTELRGFIQNNDKLGIFKYKKTRETPEEEVKSFQERSIIMLSYFEPPLNRTRYFYSFNCNSEEAGFQGALLFEILKEFKTFAVITRKTRVSLVGKDNRGLEKYTANKGLIFEQREGIFVVGEDSKMDLLLLIKNIEVDNIVKDKTKQENKVYRAALKKRMEPHWDKIENFADEKDLKFSKRDDLLSILDFARTVEGN